MFISFLRILESFSGATPLLTTRPLSSFPEIFFSSRSPSSRSLLSSASEGEKSVSEESDSKGFELNLSFCEFFNILWEFMEFLGSFCIITSLY